jgi:DNA-binding SARP family transcriptional activator
MPQYRDNLHKDGEMSCCPVFVGLLGNFRLLSQGRPIAQRGRKIEQLLSILALRLDRPTTRSMLLQAIWPECDRELASQSLNSLIYHLRKGLRGALADQPPILCDDSVYRLNTQAGITVDVAIFDRHFKAAKQLHCAGDSDGAAAEMHQAVQLYHGDLIDTSLVELAVERERLRSEYLDSLSYLADGALRRREWEAGLDLGHAMLKADPCLEEAHRILMRCYAALGKRTQAIRQFELCRDVLRQEFDLEPERETLLLERAIRDGNA